MGYQQSLIYLVIKKLGAGKVAVRSRRVIQLQ